jgi:hypothetical protein
MLCPFCGDRRTEVLETIYRSHSTYRHRRCLYCKASFSTREKQVPWHRVHRKWPGKRPSRKGWRGSRIPALRGNCEVESCNVNFQLEDVKLVVSLELVAMAGSAYTLKVFTAVRIASS